MDILVLGTKEIRDLLSMKECIEVQEQAFRALAEGKCKNAPSSWFNVEKCKGRFKTMTSSLELDGDHVALKLIGGARQPKRTTLGFVLLIDAVSLYPLAILDGISITAWRTGAGGALATKWLARRGSSSVGILGTGRTASFTLCAIKKLLPEVAEAKVYSRNEEHREKFSEGMSRFLGMNVKGEDDPHQAVKNVDIVITGTDSDDPVYFEKWLEPGTLINTMGRRGEIEPSTLKRCKIVVDEREAALADGKCGVAIRAGVLRKEDIYADLAEVIMGVKPGRTQDIETIVFDSSGVAVQDVALAAFLYRKAVSKGIGVKAPFSEDVSQDPFTKAMSLI